MELASWAVLVAAVGAARAPPCNAAAQSAAKFRPVARLKPGVGRVVMGSSPGDAPGELQKGQRQLRVPQATEFAAIATKRKDQQEAVRRPLIKINTSVCTRPFRAAPPPACLMPCVPPIPPPSTRPRGGARA